MTTKGAFIAAAVAGLFTAGTPMLASAKDTAKVHCSGRQRLQGQGRLQGRGQLCKGQNGCKGKGWVEMSDKECKDKGGTAAPRAGEEVAKRRATAPPPSWSGTLEIRHGEFPYLGHGVGLRPPHYAEVLDGHPRRRLVRGDLRELHGRRRQPAARPASRSARATRSCCTACRCRSARSIRSTRRTSTSWRRSPQRIEPAWISDHLCWTELGGHNAHDLLPLPYTEEALAHVVERVRRVQDRLGRRILLENVSSYLDVSRTRRCPSGSSSPRSPSAPTAASCSTSTTSTSARINHGFDPPSVPRRRSRRARRADPPRRPQRPGHAPARHARPPGVRRGLGALSRGRRRFGAVSDADRVGRPHPAAAPR